MFSPHSNFFHNGREVTFYFVARLLAEISD
jgi:hypothetical protein